MEVSTDVASSLRSLSEMGFPTTFEMICKLGQEYTRDFLERYDTYLMENRDKEAYRNKGKRTTNVKTVYGEVEYERRVYEVTREDGIKEFVYLLDEQLEISGVGLISMNMAEQMVSSITEMSYRETAEKKKPDFEKGHTA